MSTELAIVPWWRRWLPALWRRSPPVLEARLVQEGSHKAGADFAAAYPVEPGYSVEQAMSAYAAIAWVYIAATAVAEDIARVPVKVYIGRRKGAEALPDSHPAVRILAQPNSQTSAGQLTRQRVLDRMLTGNAYRRVIGVGTRPTGQLRLHPERIRAVSASNGLVDHWVYRWDLEQRLTVDEVLWDHGPSWESGPEGLYGQGVIRALHHVLTADEAAWERRAQAQARGRPDAIVSPNGDDDNWTDSQVKDMKRVVEKVFDASHGGVAVLGERLKVDMLSWRPDQLGGQNIHTDVRQAVLSAFGVPAARVGLPSQDPAAEMLWYYQNTIMPKTAEFDETDTRLVERLDARAWVEHDYSDVAALQDDRTKRQTRVKQWVELGYDTVTAGELEGFYGLPVPKNAPLSTPGSKPMDGVDQKVNAKPKAPAAAEPAPVEDATLDNAAAWLTGQFEDANREEVAAWLTEGGPPQ